MTSIDTLPPELGSFIGSEHMEFAVKAGRAQPLRNSISTLLFGLFWTGFTSIFVVAFLGPLFLGKEVHITANGVPVVASLNNFGPVAVPALIIILFMLVGIAILSWGLYSLFQKGGYFVGTPIRLVSCQKGKMRSIDWEQFSGDIEVSGDNNKGNLSLKMRTGRMVSTKNGPDKYVPDVVYISAIENVFEIEKICRRRIKENDPTPAQVEEILINADGTANY